MEVQQILRPRLDLSGRKAPYHPQRNSGCSMTMGPRTMRHTGRRSEHGETQGTVGDSGSQKRMVTADEERWANLASLRVFNKPLAALMEDFDRAIGGISVETLASLIELGKEIEAADASRATASDASPVQRSRKAQFKKW